MPLLTLTTPNRPIQTAQVKFDKDEYVDPETGKERRKFPCVVPALVIAKVVYTATEARRRAEEDDMYWNAFQQVCAHMRAESRFSSVSTLVASLTPASRRACLQTEDDIEDWCESKVGRKRLQQEMKKRQKLVAKDVQTGEATKREKETAVHGAEDTLELISQRKKDFDEGKPGKSPPEGTQRRESQHRRPRWPLPDCCIHATPFRS